MPYFESRSVSRRVRRTFGFTFMVIICMALVVPWTFSLESDEENKEGHLFLWVVFIGFAIVHTVFAWIYLRVLVGFTIPILAIFVRCSFPSVPHC